MTLMMSLASLHTALVGANNTCTEYCSLGFNMISLLSDSLSLLPYRLCIYKHNSSKSLSWHLVLFFKQKFKLLFLHQINTEYFFSDQFPFWTTSLTRYKTIIPENHHVLTWFPAVTSTFPGPHSSVWYSVACPYPGELHPTTRKSCYSPGVPETSETDCRGGRLGSCTPHPSEGSHSWGRLVQLPSPLNYKNGTNQTDSIPSKMIGKK